MGTAAARPITVGPAEQGFLPDELLEEIFLRLDAADDLARASAACTLFRRIVCARRFVRRFRSLHPAPVLGFFQFNAPGSLHPAPVLGFFQFNAPGGFHPAEPPHPSAPAARALTQAIDFAFSVIPNPDSWRVLDAQDGRVLLAAGFIPTTLDLVVCDPLYRRYVQIPKIPDDLVASTGNNGEMVFLPFLAPAGEDEEEESSFRVIYNAMSGSEVYGFVTFVFSSVTKEWRGVKSLSIFPHVRFCDLGWSMRYYVHSSFYWTCLSWEFLFVLDTREMKYSVIGLPHGVLREDLVVVDAGDDRLGFLALNSRTLDLYCKNLRNNDVDAEEWQHQKTVPLPELDCEWRIRGGSNGYVLLEAILPLPQFNGSSWEKPKSQYFTLEVKRLLVERLCVADMCLLRTCIYTNFPPPMSLLSI
ncbi:hypothetical protein ACP70R_032505 [Stipagrostis hirtigluma subsp. patula]